MVVKRVRERTSGGESAAPVAAGSGFQLVPKKIFFTAGKGVHKDRLSSFELSLREAGVEKANLVTVSSIFPPNCKIITKERGIQLLAPGQIVHCVMARQDTNEANRLIAASIGVAIPADGNTYGYLSEHHSYGETGKKAGDYAEDLAATMLATTMGVEFDPNKNYDERKEQYRMSGKIVNTRSVQQSAEGDKDGRWTTVVALGIFIF